MTLASKKLKELIDEVTSKKTEVDWDRVLVEWKNYVHNLYEQVESWIRKSGAFNKVKLDKQEITISESYLGSYQIDQLIWTVGDHIIHFVPQGRLIVGAKGRVDIICGNQKVLLLLLSRDGQPSIKIQEFNADLGYEQYQKHEDKKIQKHSSQELVWKISRQIPTTEVSLFTENKFTEVFEQLIA